MAKGRAKAGERGLIMVYVSEKVRPDAINFRRTIIGSVDFARAVKGAVCVELASGSAEGGNVRIRYGVDLTPLIVFMDRGGYEFGRIGRESNLAGALFEARRAVRLHAGYWAARDKVASDPDDAASNLVLAEVFAQRGGRHLAEHHLRIAESGSLDAQTLARAYLTIGDMHQVRRRYDDALKYFEKSETMSSDPNTRCYALFSSGYCLLSLQKRTSAKAYFERAAATQGAEPAWIEDARQQVRRLSG